MGAASERTMEGVGVMAQPASSETEAAMDGSSAVSHRVEAAATLLAVVAVLTLALVLQPSPDGVGTHEQLVPIPCGFRTITGLPCPMCGMTTAFAHMARWQVGAALRVHVLGPAAWLAACVIGLMAIRGMIWDVPVTPRWLQRPWVPKTFFALILAGWIANIALRISG
ncbi:MAG: DUF2752 domain-containing protein [Armatimonadota bacterium]